MPWDPPGPGACAARAEFTGRNPRAVGWLWLFLRGGGLVSSISPGVCGAEAADCWAGLSLEDLGGPGSQQAHVWVKTLRFWPMLGY